MITILLSLLLSLLGMGNVQAQNVVVIPPMPQVAPEFVEELEWLEFTAEAYEEYADEFTALFNSYETKWSKNNRLMLKKPADKSFKFVAKGK